MNKAQFDICIIGAGASGLVAAIESSRRGLSCVVVDKNKKPGNKLYATGNGRCNLTNDRWEEDSYYGNDFADRVFDTLYKETQLRPRSFVLDYFKNLGITTINKNGYYYPASLQASSVVWALTDAARISGAEIRCNTKVNSIIYNNSTDDYDEDYYHISGIQGKGENKTPFDIYSKKIILSTGGISQPELGAASIKDQETLFNGLYLPYNPFSAELCSVKCSNDLSLLNGVRTKARVIANGHSESGEVQFTENTVSGIVVFNMSHYINSGDVVVLNLLSVSQDEFVNHFKSIKKNYPERTLTAFLNGYINDKLALYFKNSFYGEEIKIQLKDVTESGIRALYEEMSNMEINVISKSDASVSQASSGGIRTDIINPENMAVMPGTFNNSLFATGEITDVIGKCGGYNLTYAFVSGFLAGRNV